MNDPAILTSPSWTLGRKAHLFYVTGEPFCEDRDCRLFNSHWQEEVLHSQLDGQYEFCSRHEGILKGLRERS